MQVKKKKLLNCNLFTLCKDSHVGISDMMMQTKKKATFVQVDIINIEFLKFLHIFAPVNDV